MAFLNQFATYFTTQEQQTELYQMWSSIGVNMEKTILEEQNRVNTEFTDINNFSEDTLRSWLAFFLQKIPYRTTSTTQVTVSLNGNYAKTEIPKFDTLSTDSGIIYTLMEDIVISPGDEMTVTAVQGNRIVETGTYNSIIKVQATNPDLSYLTVSVDGQEIPEVSYQTSYDNLSFLGSWKPQSMEDKEWGGTPFLQNEFGKKGNAYWVIGDGITKFSEDSTSIEFRNGDIVVYDGEKWQRSAKSNQLNPVQFANSYAVPSNGYFAYYYNDYLYIKIFAGSEIPMPNGRPYEISYIQSDGIQGQTKKNTLSFVSAYEDMNENTVKLNVSNTESTVAINEPSVGKLGLYLKQRLYSTINVSSIPEYTAWFNAQPEVGDCMVLSDWERYVRTGKTHLDVTGIVNVYLVDPNGKELTSEVKERLLDRIENYKDLAVLTISTFTQVKQYLAFEYTTSTSENAFEQFVKTKASQYYNLDYLHSKNASLFDNLDLAAIVQDIQNTSPYASTGLILKGYHYWAEDFTSAVKVKIINSYSNEKPGMGWYILKTNLGTEYRFEEIESAGTENSCLIYDPDYPAENIGSHTGQIVSIDLRRYEFDTAVLECYWAMENEGILSIGAEDGLRQLHEISITKVK